MATTIRTAAVVIIGGGVTGASTAFHLTQRGIRDVVLVDKGSLASGGTGKSSACVRQHYSTAETCRMILYSLDFFQHFGERVGGESCGFRHTGYLLGVDDRMRAPMEASVALQRSVVETAEGNLLAGVALLAVGVAWVLAIAWVWHRLLARMLVTPDTSPRPARERHARGFTAGWWGPRSVLARKELRFYVRDPRLRLVWTGTVIFVGLAVAGLVVGSEAFASFRQAEWLPLLAPALVLFVGLPIALNQFGWERNAASYLFVLPASPRQLLVGKNMATVCGVSPMCEAVGMPASTSAFRMCAWLLPPCGLTASLPASCMKRVALASARSGVL